MLWGSMPCTGGSVRAPHNFAKGGSAADTVMMHREIFESSWYNFTRVATLTHLRGGKIPIEWPAGCSYWKLAHVQKFMSKLGIVHFARIDGCMGIPRKRFTVVTNDQTLFDTLSSVRCDGKHKHTPLL